MLQRLADAWHQNLAETVAQPLTSSQLWSLSSSGKDLYGVWLIAAAKDEWIELREKVGSLQTTISCMTTQISSLIFKLNQIDFATLAAIAAEKKAKDYEAAATAARKEAPLPLLQ